MGSSSSKVARSATGATARRYPVKPSHLTTSPSPNSSPPAAAQQQPTPTWPKQPQQQPLPPSEPSFDSLRQPSDKRTKAIDLDATDPIYASQLRSIGPVQPVSMHSNSSIAPEDGFATSRAPPPGFFPDPRNNPAVALLNRRKQLQEEAEKEFDNVGRKGFSGRQFIDTVTIRQILFLRYERKKSADEIEKMLGLQQGIVAKLGAQGVVEGT